ncbi:thiamine ABC transporter ATP-binding protein [Aestuariivirga litoralis]|uniref:thiamine ABC transporter ATP-binding protein n=1 Tax=Aestuariivirga litoralis TaxID=2650924 RepID=UPI001FEF83B6|nr:ATP-binding cassette domain-containing protein [Aestuariivirga litoralis]
MLRIENGLYRHGAFSLQIALDVPASSLTAVLGPSGAGKSTLLNVIAGFEKLETGRVIIDGTDVTAQPPATRAVSMVFQDNNVFPHLTLWQNVALGVSPSLTLSDAQKQSVYDALARVGLFQLASRKPGDVSGGERQRVALARVLVRRANVLLLDEPFAALDPGLRAEMLHLVREISEAQKLATLLVTHQPEEIRGAVDGIIFLAQGKVQNFNTQDFFTSKLPSVRSYLGSDTKATKD